MKRHHTIHLSKTKCQSRFQRNLDFFCQRGIKFWTLPARVINSSVKTRANFPTNAYWRPQSNWNVGIFVNCTALEIESAAGLWLFSTNQLSYLVAVVIMIVFWWCRFRGKGPKGAAFLARIKTLIHRLITFGGSDRMPPLTALFSKKKCFLFNTHITRQTQKWCQVKTTHSRAIVSWCLFSHVTPRVKQGEKITATKVQKTVTASLPQILPLPREKIPKMWPSISHLFVSLFCCVDFQCLQSSCKSYTNPLKAP